MSASLELASGHGVAALAAVAQATEGVTVVAQTRQLTERVLIGAARILGVSLIAAGVAAVVALLYRWYVRERVPGGLPALFGLSAIVPLLGATDLLQNVIDPAEGGTLPTEAMALFHIAAILVALGATRVGADVGDRIGNDLTVATGERAVEAEVGRLVQAVGRVITVELPEEIDDIVGYDPVPAQTKETLAGKTFVFPRRLTVEELRDRLVTRLKADYAVGHVDVELAADGTVEFLAVGSRAAGIGPTLPPETSAVAVQADPAFAASAGDLVQVWRTDPSERVLTAEVRGTVDDVVTLAVDAADTRKLDAEASYRLVTLPVEARPDREFASVLRAADETMAAVTVAEDSPLVGQPLGAIDVTVVAVRPREGPVEPLPARDRVLAATDSLYLVAAPEAIRKVEQAATSSVGPSTADPTASTAPTAESGARLAPEEQVDATTPVAGETADSAPYPAADAGGATDPPESVGDGPATDESPGSDRSAGADDLSDADAPGIQALEDDGSADESPTGDGDSTEGDSADGEPTRDDLEDLAGVDVDDLTGTDVAVEANGEPDEQAERTVDEPDYETVDGDEADSASGGETTGEGESTGEDGTATVDADGDRASDDTGDDGGWTVAVDERRDADADK